MDIYQKAKAIDDQTDFVDFLELLKNDLQNNRKSWENDNLETYLNGFHGYCMDSIINNDLNWRRLAEILLAARVYE